MSKQHRTNNQFMDDGQNHPSSNYRAMPQETPRKRQGTDDVILLKPKHKRPSIPKEQKQSTTSYGLPKSAQKQPQLPSRLVPRHSKQSTGKAHSTAHSNNSMDFWGGLALGALLILLGAIWFVGVQRNSSHDETVSLNPLTSLIGPSKTRSQKAFQKAWKKMEREEKKAAIAASKSHGKAVETKKKVVEKEEETVVGQTSVDSAESSVIENSAESAVIEKSAESEDIENKKSETIDSVEHATTEAEAEADDSDDSLVMDFLKRNVGHVGRTTTPRVTGSVNMRQRAPAQQFAPIGRWSPGNLERHWAKHGHEFPQYHSAAEYGMGALYFFENPPPGTKRKTRGNGDCLYYHPASNTFGVTTADGTPKTMFKPDSGMDYWNRQ